MTVRHSRTDSLFWSRAPGKFVNKFTGQTPIPVAGGISGGPHFEGTVREWYETFVESIVDGANILFKRNLQPAKVVEVGTDVFTILSHTVGFVPAQYAKRPLEAVPPGSEGEVKGTVSTLTVVLNEKLPNNEARVQVVNNYVCSVVPGKPVPESLYQLPVFTGPDVTSTVAPIEIQEPSIPEIELKPLPDRQVIDSITVYVLDMNVL